MTVLLEFPPQLLNWMQAKQERKVYHGQFYSGARKIVISPVHCQCLEYYYDCQGDNVINHQC